MQKVDVGVMLAAAEELKKFNDPAREQYEPFLSKALLRAVTLLEYMAKHHAEEDGATSDGPVVHFEPMSKDERMKLLKAVWVRLLAETMDADHERS